MLTGTISTRLGDLVKLEDLRLGENGFTGNLPPQIARLTLLGKSMIQHLHSIAVARCSVGCACYVPTHSHFGLLRLYAT